MNLEIIKGASGLAQLMVIGSSIMIGVEILIALFAVCYHRFAYKQRCKAYNRAWEPFCSIFVPCKNVIKDLAENLRSFTTVEYSNYEVIFTVESDVDPALPIIRDVIKDCKNAKVVVAGHSETCAQKNWNLLAAIDAAKTPELYVFADADIQPNANWLRELILPLSHKKVTITTGFRWLHAKSGTLGEIVHVSVNVFLYSVFCFVATIGGVGLWGGSMAMRRTDFDKLNVRKRWAETVVDDMSLSQIIMMRLKKAVLVPTCVTHTSDAIDTVSGTVRWYERQIMFLKSYQKPIWATLGIAYYICACFFLAWFPIALVAKFFFGQSFFGIGGAAPVIYILGLMVIALISTGLGKIHDLTRYVVAQPFLRLMHAFSFIRTMFTNTIVWSGIKYKMSFTGKVKSVERLV